MPATVVTSVSSRSRIDRARAWLQARDAAEEVLILGASLGAANELARSLVKTKGAAFGWHRLTLAQLAANVALPALTERKLAPISQIGTEVTVALLVHRLRTEGRIGGFEPIAKTPGLPRALAAVTTELRLAELSPEAVASVAPDVAPLLAAYEAELAQLALTDWPGILALAAENASAHRLSGLPLLVLDVPLESEAELAFLRALAEGAPEIFATVPAADEPTLARLRDELHWPIEDLDLRIVPVRDTALERLQRNLFKEGASQAWGNPATGVDIFSARARAGNASKSPGVYWHGLAIGFPSTAWPSFCAPPKSIAPILRRPSTAPAYRFISPVAPGVPTRPGAPSSPCSNAPRKACRPAASPNTCHWDKCLTRPPRAHRRQPPHAATNGSNWTPRR